MSEIQIIESKSSNDEIQILNSNTGEFMIFKNIRNIENNTMIFNVETSTGLKYENIIYKSDSVDQKCGWCPFIPIIIDTVKEIIKENDNSGYDANCAAAIDACGENGVESITIIDGGWFSDSSCTVVCNNN